MTAVEPADIDAARPTGAEDVSWDLEPLVHGEGPAGVHRLLASALSAAQALSADLKGRIGSLSASELAAALERLAGIQIDAGRASAYASLRFSTDVSDPERGALVQKVQEQAAEVGAELVWFELEWLAVPDEQAVGLLADEALASHRHHLETARARRPHVLSEAEERLLTQKAPTGRGAWVRLFTEQTSAIQVSLEGVEVPLEVGLSKLSHPERPVRSRAAAAVTEALQPGLRTRAFIYNTLIADKAIDDRLRSYPSWISAWNQGNEASDESVEALVSAVVDRYDIPQRWYRLKAQALGLSRLADYDRAASVAASERHVPWDEACAIVRDSYGSFSDELAGVVERFLTEGWIDAPVRQGKRGGAFCSYTVPDHHPYVFLNYTATPGDVLTLAHELGHAVHGYLARPQGVFHQATPLTLAETASVFGETVTFERLLEQVEDPADRFALLAQNVEGAIATVFRQVAMNRFEDAVHTHRREQGELSVDDFCGHWATTQSALFGDAVEVTDGYRCWWSYIPHFIGTPGYVYAYAYGQLLALSVYARYVAAGTGFVPQYLDLLRAGGSRWPEELGKIVDCDLRDPGFWSAGLEIVDSQLSRAEAAARDAGRVS